MKVFVTRSCWNCYMASTLRELKSFTVAYSDSERVQVARTVLRWLVFAFPNRGWKRIVFRM